MKRTVLICFFAVITMVFTGCKSSNVNDYKKANNYKIHEKEYKAYYKGNKPFKVKYAQISSLDNESLENHINQTLKLSMTDWINKNCDWVKKFKMIVKCKSFKYLSLCYTIEWRNPRGKDYVNNTYTRIGVTVDMQTGNRVYLNDLIKDTDGLKQKLEKYSYKSEFSSPIKSDEATEIIHYASISEKKYYKEIYKTDPHVYEIMIDYSGAKPSFYLTNNKLVIIRDRYTLNDVYIDFKQ